MYESLPELFMTGCGLLQFAYWLGWAWLLIATDSEALDDILDRENERLRRLLCESRPAGTLFLQWVDRNMMSLWHRMNRPCFASTFPEDPVSALGRLGFFVEGQSPWTLQRIPISARKT